MLSREWRVYQWMMPAFALLPATDNTNRTIERLGTTGMAIIEMKKQVLSWPRRLCDFSRSRRRPLTNQETRVAPAMPTRSSGES